MTKEDASIEFTLKEINKRRNYLLEEIKHNELISKKHKKTFRNLNLNLNCELILASTVSSCVYISTCASLVGSPIEIISSTATIKICVITVGIKNYYGIVETICRLFLFHPLLNVSQRKF